MNIFQKLNDLFTFYNSRIAKLFNVQVMIFLGIVFVATEQTLQSSNMANVRRRQYFEDVCMMLPIVCIVLLIFACVLHLPVTLADIAANALFVLFWSNLVYAITALLSYVIMKRKSPIQDDTFYASIHRLDMLKYSNGFTKRRPFNHYTYCNKVLSVGRKYKTRGFFVDVC